MGRNGNLAAMGSTVIDTGPVMVRGAFRARYARVVWQNGTMHIVWRAQGRIHRHVLATSEPSRPETANGYFRAVTDEGQSIAFTRRGCGG
jgi:hypothetical protein